MLWALLSVALAFAYASVLDLITIYIERKGWGKIMQRYGPTHVGFGGSLQLIADFIKYLSKELFRPRKAYKVLYYAIPLAMIAIVTVPLVLLPFDYVALSGIDGVLRLFGIKSNLASHSASLYIDKAAPGLGVIGYLASLAILAPMLFALSWIQQNKFSLLAAYRSVLLFIAFEIPFIISLASLIALNGPSVYNASKTPLLFLNPIAFLALIVAILAEAERPPFDHPEAEQEIVHGWNVEYGAGEFILLYGIYLYSKAIYAAGIITVFMLGGWSGPHLGLPLPLERAIWFTVKLVAVFWLFVLLRAALARPRVDQILDIGWGKALYLALLALLLSITEKVII